MEYCEKSLVYSRAFHYKIKTFLLKKNYILLTNCKFYCNDVKLILINYRFPNIIHILYVSFKLQLTLKELQLTCLRTYRLFSPADSTTEPRLLDYCKYKFVAVFVRDIESPRIDRLI